MAENSIEVEGNVPLDDETAATLAALESGGAASPPEAASAEVADPSISAEAPAEEAAPAEPKKDWKDKRIAQLTAQLRQAVPATPPAAGAPASVPSDPAELDRLVEARSAQKLEEEEFNRRCDEAVKAGRQKFGAEEFDSRLDGIRGLVNPNSKPEVQQYVQFLQLAAESDNFDAIVHELGGDLNRAVDFLALPEKKMALEIGKLDARLGAAEAVKAVSEISRAPKPLLPVTPSGRGTPIDPADPDKADTLTTAEWMRRRNEQIGPVGARKAGR